VVDGCEVAWLLLRLHYAGWRRRALTTLQHPSTKTTPGLELVLIPSTLKKLRTHSLDLSARVLSPARSFSTSAINKLLPFMLQSIG
jgi:hypothetical protein